MSWFKHKPRPKTPPKLHAHHSSPISEKILKETKLEVTGVKAKLAEQEKKEEMTSRELQLMYQQWCQGNENYDFRWLDFVEMAARQFKQPESEVLRELQKHYWFVKNNK